MLLIWWTNSKDCDLIGRKMSDNSPGWLYDLYLSRFGRAGEGRIWADQDRDGHNAYRVLSWPETEFARQIRTYYGGMVIEAKNYKKCPFGLFTDNRIVQYLPEEIERILIQEKEQEQLNKSQAIRWLA